jgi:hypothetical protein
MWQLVTRNRLPAAVQKRGGVSHLMRGRANGPAATAPVNAGQLKITQVTDGDAIPVEGALSYIRIERETGAALTERQLPGSHQLWLRVPPGAYRLVSWQRTCDGDCGYLDPPSNRCARPFPLRPGEELDVAIRVNFTSGCVIVLHRSNTGMPGL